MATYSIHFLCNECGQEHQVGTCITLEAGPEDKASVSDIYHGRDLPLQIATAKSNITWCPKTCMLTSQEDNDRVFLVPMANVK